MHSRTVKHSVTLEARHGRQWSSSQGDVPAPAGDVPTLPASGPGAAARAGGGAPVRAWRSGVADVLTGADHSADSWAALARAKAPAGPAAAAATAAAPSCCWCGGAPAASSEACVRP